MEPPLDEKRKAHHSFSWVDSKEATFQEVRHSAIGMEPYSPRHDQDDTYKTVVYEDAQVMSSKKWDSGAYYAGNDPDSDTNKTAVFNESDIDTNKYAMDPEPETSAPAPSHRRRNIIIGIIGVLLVVAIVAGAVGGVEANRHKNKNRGKAILPGSDISATDRGNDTQLFYQNGDGKILTVTCVHPDPQAWQAANNCGSTTNTGISDAKMSTALASVNSSTGVTLFYLNSDNHLRAFTTPPSADAVDDEITSLSLEAHKNSRLSAIFSADSDRGTIRLFYQDPEDIIQEVVRTDSWDIGSSLGEATPGSKLGSVTWNEWTLATSSPREIHQIRAYHEATNNTFMEMAWSNLTGWYPGPWYPSAPTLHPQAGMATLAWLSLANKGKSYGLDFHTFGIDTTNSLLDFGSTLAANGFKAGQSNVLKYDYAPDPTNPLAAVWWPESNSTDGLQASMRIYYQQTGDNAQKMLGEYMWSDTAGVNEWKAGNGIPLRSV